MGVNLIDIDKAKVCAALKAKNLTQYSVSEKMGYEKTWVSVTLRKGKMPKSSLKLLSMILDVPESDLLPDREPKEEPKAVVSNSGSNDDLIRLLREIERNQREMLKAINLIKLDAATMRFAGEERDKTIGYIHKTLGDFVGLFEDKEAKI